MPNVVLHNAETLETLRLMPDGCIDCAVTSPPYFGLRDYKTGHWEGGDPACDHAQEMPRFNGKKQVSSQVSGHASRAEKNGRKQCHKCGAIRVDKQIGIEDSPEEYVERLRLVFSEVRRSLKPSGTLWLNLGDSYCNNTSLCTASLKEKDLIGIPWRVAFALQADGWYLRSDIVWQKPNCMPESIKDRPTRSHEYIFLLTKSKKYFFNPSALMEKAVSDKKKWTDHGSEKQRGHSRRHAGFNGRYAEKIEKEGAPKTRNGRDVWSISTIPYKGAHFAVFPKELPLRCIGAGCPEGGTVLDPFSGSGTTLEAAMELNRSSIGIELNPAYYQLSIERLTKAGFPLKIENPSQSFSVASSI